MEDLGNLTARVAEYHRILKNTIDYRSVWQASLKSRIKENLETIIKETGLNASVELKDEFENMEAIVLSLGKAKSGIAEKLEGGDIKRELIKMNGALTYQQLFNGKIMVTAVYPFIEGYGEPRPPRMIEILRPEELKPPFIVRHMETFMKDIVDWEDYDDDDQAAPTKIGFGQQLQLQTDELPPSEG